VGLRLVLDAVAKRKVPFPAPTGNRINSLNAINEKFLL
jgi:hypothetical protein